MCWLVFVLLMMEIVHVYSRLRAQFGRQSLLSDRAAELLLDLVPEPSLAQQFILKTPREQALQAGSELSEHQVTSTPDSEHLDLTHLNPGGPVVLGQTLLTFLIMRL